jgi:hypothetical protein
MMQGSISNAGIVKQYSLPLGQLLLTLLHCKARDLCEVPAVNNVTGQSALVIAMARQSRVELSQWLCRYVFKLLMGSFSHT